MTTTMIEREIEVASELGLHARPAAAFAQAAARFASSVTVVKGDREADGKSVLMVLTLDVRCGDRIRIRVSGPDAQRALDELSGMVETP